MGIEVIGYLLIALALVFEFVNGFHDTANAVTTVIYSKAMKPRNAIWMSAICNFAGAVTVGTAVAMLITKIVPATAVNSYLITSVLIGGLIWNLGTWYKGIPASSSHCLIGSLIGACVISVGWEPVWNSPEVWKTLKGLGISPLIGLSLALVVSTLVAFFARPVGRMFNSAVHGLVGNKVEDPSTKVVQIGSAAALSFTHGANDGQKMMGVITMVLVSHFHGYLPGVVPFWVMVVCAIAIGLGTAIGGERIIKTVGEKLSSKPMDSSTGNAAQVTSALTIFGATLVGVPVSTTHVLNSAVIGATAGTNMVNSEEKGLVNRLKNGWAALSPRIILKILSAWVFTMPVCGLMAAGIYLLLKAVF